MKFFSLLLGFGTLGNDMVSWQGWAHRLAALPYNQFYQQWSDYLPGYLYILGILGKIGEGEWIYKLPAIVADILGATLIYIIGRKQKIKFKWTIFVSSIYLLNPSVWGTSVVWGQMDSVSSFLGVLAVWLFANNNILSGIVLGWAVVTKPTAIVAAIVIAVFGLYKRNTRSLFITGLLSVITIFGLFIPFAPNIRDLLGFMMERANVTANQYPYATVNAFNFWSVIGQNWVRDQYQILGLTLFVMSSVITVKLIKIKDVFDLFLLQSVLSAAFFFWMTRMHERHLFPVFLPLALAALKNPHLLVSYTLFSLGFLVNLRFAYTWITQSFKEIFSKSIQQIISLYVPVSTFFLFKLPKINMNLSNPIPSSPVSRYWPILILCLLTATRLLRLDYPPEHYFDEVYHAFTAQQMLLHNHAAWEWWNTPPAGFAYEWTHPPVAKLFMVSGLWLLGNNPVGWRVPGAVIGVLAGLILYLIVFKITKNKLVSSLALFFYTIDGLSLTTSRIGMNDIYVVFFLLLTWLLLLRKQKLIASIIYGIALGSKWTAIYFFPVYLYYLTPSYYLLITPVLVYLAVYLPFFSFGHNLGKFIELQQQMWWYHTGLKATHGYSSAAWTWPLLLRPVWTFVQYLPTKVSNIYLMGNPLLMWAGLIALVFQIKKINHFILGYSLFLLPWIASPRIMFYYHYFPSATMLYAILAIQLAKIRNKKIIYTICATLLLSFIFFLPRYLGIAVPSEYVKYWEWLPSWK